MSKKHPTTRNGPVMIETDLGDVERRLAGVLGVSVKQLREADVRDFSSGFTGRFSLASAVSRCVRGVLRREKDASHDEYVAAIGTPQEKNKRDRFVAARSLYERRSVVG